MNGGENDRKFYLTLWGVFLPMGDLIIANPRSLLWDHLLK